MTLQSAARSAKSRYSIKKGTGKSGSLNLFIIKRLLTEFSSEELPVETGDMLD